ncbi:MAG: DUF1286 domain-containing protein [Thaumarchaeota archaeon]|nr:DUF1286 domain-containing protein [Nitrososphaerota archaeon]
MKSLTHNLFSAGLGLYLVSRSGLPLLLELLLVAWLSLAINWVIDILGHKKSGGIPIRTFVTHSIFTAPLWGGLVGLATILVPQNVLSIHVSSTLTLLAITTSMMIACLHLLLDSLTEGGVYLGRRRIAIAHFSYNNPVLNLGFMIIGATLLIVSFF